MKFKHHILFLPLALLAACSGNKEETKTEQAPPPVSKFALAEVQKADMEQTVKLPGQLAAWQEVSIFPKVNGYVKNVSVDIGSKVGGGQLLMTLEAPEVQQAVLQAKEKYERAKSDFAINRENYLRLRTASKTAGAIAPMDLASARAKMEADSSLSNAEKANWQMQQAMMAYLRVTAPFNGIITERNTHPGALVSAEAKDKPLLELKQVDHLRLQVDVPEQLTSTLKNKGKVDFYLTAFPGKKMSASIARVSGNMNSQYRAERVELDVPNPQGQLTPGMFADVILQAKGNPEAMTVPKSAVVTSTERKYVLAVRNGQAVKVDVTTGIESNNKVEVLGDLKTGDKVIAAANDEIEEGTKIN